MKILTERKYSFMTTTETGIDCNVKEKLGYMSLDNDNELKIDLGKFRQDSVLRAPRQKHHLSRRRTFVLLASFIDIQASGILDTSFQSNMKCYVNFRTELYANIVFPSGKTLRLRWHHGWASHIRLHTMEDELEPLLED